MILEFLLYAILTAQLMLVSIAVTVFLLTMDKPKKSNKERIDELESRLNKLK